MKRFTLTLLIALIGVGTIFAQIPQAFKYQAVVRDNLGNILANQSVSFRIGILENEIGGNAIYVETHNATTNQFGLVTLEIGNGYVLLGSFLSIDWYNGLFFIKTEVDDNGGTNFQFLGATQLLSVPFSILSEQSRGLILTDEDGNSYTIGVDTNGVITTTIISAGVSCGDSIIDSRDGQKYATIMIGNQCWMAENLNIGTRIDAPINPSNNSIIEKYCYNDNMDSCYVYGGLYQWDEMMQYSLVQGAQGICLEGWHLPIHEEWTELFDYLGGSNVAGGKMKEVGYDHWNPPNTDASNTSGFTALGAGLYTGIEFTPIGETTWFWHSTEYNSTKGIASLIGNYSGSITNVGGDKTGSMSVRCIKDESNINQPPSQPFQPHPENSSVNINIDTILSWSCIDPENDPITFDVYFGETNPPPLFSSGLTSTTFNPEPLNDNTTYYWKIIAHDDQLNTTEGITWNFTTIEQLWSCGDDLMDIRDNQYYSTIQIGTQCWMTRNLNIGLRIDGNTDQTDNSTLEKYCYNDTDSNCDTYGGLYQWDETMQYVTTIGTIGICPQGWHVPSTDEWCILENEVDAGTIDCSSLFWRGIDAGDHLKESGTTHWNPPITSATNSSGFTALPGGYSSTGGAYTGFGVLADFWTSTNSGSNIAYDRSLISNKSQIWQFPLDRTRGFSVRCIKD